MPIGPQRRVETTTATAIHLAWVPGVAAGLVMAMAALVLLGWWTGVEGLKGFGLESGTMKPSTALGLLAGGASLWLARTAVVAPLRRGLARGAAVFTAAVGGLALTEYVLGVEAGLAGLLAEGATRMSVSSAVGLLGLGLALLGLDHPTRDGGRPTHVFALVAGLVSGMALLGHLYGVKSFHTLWAEGRLSVPAAAGQFILALGILCSRAGPDAWQLLTRAGPGGAVARGLLPVVVLLPVGLDGLRLIAEGERVGMEPALAVALHTTVTAVLLVFFVWWAAAWAERAESRRAALADDLRESERRARETVDCLPQLVWTCRPDGPCDYLSPQWVRYTGVPEHEQLGYAWLERLHPDDRERTIQRWKETAGKGDPFEIEFRIRRHDGAYRWFKTRAEALRAEDGTLRRWFGTNTDIHEQRQAEDALRTAHAELEARVKERTVALETSLVRLRLAVQAAKIGVWEWELGSESLVWDEGMAEIYARPGPVPLADWRAMVCAEDRAATDKAMERALAGEVIHGHFFRIVRADGTARHIQGSALVLRAADGRPALIIGVNRDITEEREAEEALRRHQLELERSNRDLEQFAYVASHDLQEPLRAVSGCVQLLQRRHAASLSPEASELIALAVDGAWRMQGLILDLLTYSRVGTGVLRLGRVPLADAVAEALKNLQAALGGAGGAVRCEPALPVVSADRGRLVMLLQNLIGNALKYAAPGRAPEVKVSATRGEDGGWVIAVRDNGVGIEKRFFERIFVIFQRLHTRTESPGSGIGLALCKKIVERHGGRIWVESKPGEGSVFYFTLPETPVAP